MFFFELHVYNIFNFTIRHEQVDNAARIIHMLMWETWVLLNNTSYFSLTLAASLHFCLFKDGKFLDHPYRKKRI